MPSKRAVGFSLVLGVVHALGLLLVADSLEYSIGPSQYSFAGFPWRYGGLIVVAAIVGSQTVTAIVRTARYRYATEGDRIGPFVARDPETVFAEN